MIRAEAETLPDAFDEDAQGFLVDVDGFEGPLHLLLELSRRQKVNLRKVCMRALAEQYLGFIQDAKAKRIDLAAEYLVMAAWLSFLKSKLLLPKQTVEDAEASEGDSEARRLAFRLVRLEAMRKAGADLMDSDVLGRDVFVCGAPQRPKVVRETEWTATLIDLLKAFGTIRKRQEKDRPHTVEKQMVLPLEIARDKLRALAPRLAEWRAIQDLQGEMESEEDLPISTRLASVFSATLELARDGDVDIRQDCHFAPLFLRAPAEAVDAIDEKEAA